MLADLVSDLDILGSFMLILVVVGCHWLLYGLVVVAAGDGSRHSRVGFLQLQSLNLSASAARAPCCRGTALAMDASSTSALQLAALDLLAVHKAHNLRHC